MSKSSFKKAVLTNQRANQHVLVDKVKQLTYISDRYKKNQESK